MKRTDVTVQISNDLVKLNHLIDKTNDIDVAMALQKLIDLLEYTKESLK